MAANFTGYNASKLAAIKLIQDLGVEHEDLHVVTFHPGVGTLARWLTRLSHTSYAFTEQLLTVLSRRTVETYLAKKTGFDQQYDTPELPGHFAVWLCSDEAKFLRGRFLWCNWDAPEILENKGEIEGSQLFTANCMGWPFM